MKTRKKTTKKRKASPAQVAARKKFVAAAKAGKFRKSAKKAAPKKRNGKTIVKAKRVVIIQKNAKKKAARKNPKYTVEAIPKYTSTVKESVSALTRGSAIRKVKKKVAGPKNIYRYKVEKNPRRRPNVTSAQDLHLAGAATPASQGGMKGWKLTSKGKFYPGSATPKTVALNKSKTAFLDLKYGDVWKRKAKGNPKKSLIGKVFTVKGDRTQFQVVSEYKAAGFIPSVTGHTLDGKKQVNARVADIVLVKAARKQNIAGFMQDGVFHPIRSGVEQRTTKSGVRRVKSKKAYKPSKVGEARTYSAKKSAKRAAQSRRMTAATKQRKATTTRLASRSLDRSGPKKTRHNPFQKKRYNVKVKFQKDPKYYNYKLGDFWSKAEAAAAASARIGTVIDGQSVVKASPVDTGIVTATQKTVGESRRNPDTPAQLLKDFRGYPKDRDDNLRFANGTPSGLYRLGVLKKIVTTDNTINMPSSQVWLCADTKGKLYVGGLAKGASNGRVVNAPAGSLGKVTRVEYLEKKPHLGDNNKTLYFHKMGEEDGNKPTLYSDGDGNLLFRGGNYQVTYRGIVN